MRKVLFTWAGNLGLGAMTRIYWPNAIEPLIGSCRPSVSEQTLALGAQTPLNLITDIIKIATGGQGGLSRRRSVQRNIRNWERHISRFNNTQT